MVVVTHMVGLALLLLLLGRPFIVLAAVAAEAQAGVTVELAAEPMEWIAELQQRQPQTQAVAAVATTTLRLLVLAAPAS
jgi:hypothetical protein